MKKSARGKLGLNIALNPNHDNSASSDGLHIVDFLGLPSPTESCISVVPGSIIQHWTMDGVNSCVSGGSAINWEETTKVGGVSQQITIMNFHHENGTNSEAYSFDFSRVPGSEPIYQMTLINCAAAIQGNGFRVQNTQNTTFISPLFTRVGGVGLNVDNSNFNTNVIGGFFQIEAKVINQSRASPLNYNYISP